MKKLAWLAAAAMTLCATGAQAAVLYSTSNVAFAANAGPSTTLASTLSVYAIDTTFRFDVTSGYRKIVDFKALTSDNGLYNLNGALNFYPVVTGAAGTIPAGTLVNVRLTRDVAGLVSGYVNGTLQFSFTDSSGLAVFSNGKANFFIDDTATSQGEASAGYIQSLTLFDSPTQTAAVPEPATWALMMAGFGLVGAALRRRKAIAAYA